MITVGQTANFSKTISESDVYNFSGIVGDFNCLHINKVEAEKGIYGQRIAPGILVGGLISTVIGMYLPGKGSIYKSQSFNFSAPVMFGDTITATVTISEIINQSNGIYRLETIATNQNNQVVIDGEAVVKYIEEE